MKVHVICDRCGQSEVISTSREIDPTQEAVWNSYEVSNEGVEVTLCVECSSAFVRWVFEGKEIPAPEAEPEEGTPT